MSTEEKQSATNDQQQQPKKQELSQNDLNQIQETAKKILNPNNDNPTMNEYIMSTFDYIGNALLKMQTTNDKQATAKEIADDLTQKFDAWVKSREAEKNKQEQQQEATTTTTTDEKKE